MFQHFIAFCDSEIQILMLNKSAAPILHFSFINYSFLSPAQHAKHIQLKQFKSYVRPHQRNDHSLYMVPIIMSLEELVV